MIGPRISPIFSGILGRILGGGGMHYVWDSFGVGTCNVCGRGGGRVGVGDIIVSTCGVAAP